MLIPEQTREKIIQNLEKTDYSFHYKEKIISKKLLDWIKSRNKIWYITISIAILLTVLDSLGIYNFEKSFIILIFFGIWLVWKTISILLEYNFNKFKIIEEYIKNKEISEISQDNFFREYYWLDDINSEKGIRMIKDYALWKYKKKK